MPCALTQGYSLDCRDSIGGAKSVYITEFANVSGVTASAGVISAITKTTGKRFWKYNQERGNLEAKEDIETNLQNGVVLYKPTITMVLSKMQATIRNEIILLAQNDVVAVVEDKNGRFWYYGRQNGLALSQGTAGTGKNGGDLNGYNLTLTGEEPQLALEVSSAIVSGLETAG